MASEVKENGRILYIEPNYTFNADSKITTNGKEVLQAPALEDYCIAVDLVAEIVNRNNKYQTKGSFNTETQTNDIVGISWTSKENGSKVSFMSGKRVYKDQQSADYWDGITNWHAKRKDESGTFWVNSLTTDYTGAYYDEITQHGTTEMLGIKSIHVEYKHVNMPMIKITFIDVRGASLFAHAENRRVKKFNFSKLNDDDMVAAFFQCFFIQPYPRFLLTIKGFYGKPVSYELTLSSFHAKFNNETGNFEIDTEFVGYYFSFLSDVSMTALLTGPYSEYAGKDYWEKQKENGIFTLKNGEEMPTLVELYTKIQHVYADTASERANTPEEQAHALATQKMEELQKLQGMHNELLDLFTNAATSAVNGSGQKALVRVHKLTVGEWNNNKILEAEKENTEDNQEGESAGDESTDIRYMFCLTSAPNTTTFQDWAKLKNNADVANKIKAITAIIESYNTLCGKEVIDKLSTSLLEVMAVTALEKVSTKENKKSHPTVKTTYTKDNAENRKWKLLEQKINTVLNSTNYNFLDEGNKFCGNVFCLNFNYISQVDAEMQDLQEEIKSYNSDESIDKRNQVETTAIQKALGALPTIENIMRIIMAHFDTVMHMMYTCRNEILDQGRTLKSLGENSDTFSDVNIPADSTQDSTNIPPFPRIAIQQIGQDATTERVTEGWVGDIKGEYREKDLIYSIFNAADTVSVTIAKSDQELQDILNRLDTSSGNTDIEKVDSILAGNIGGYHLQYFTNLFDMFTDGFIYPTSLATANDRSEFIKAISLRAFTTLATDYYAASSIRNIAGQLGKADAYNFAKQFPSNVNSEMYKWIQGTTEDDFAKNNLEEVKKSLFENKYGYLWLYKYPVKGGLAYPVQNYSLDDGTSVYASPNASYIRYMPKLTIGEGLQYGKNNITYKVVDFETIKQIPTTISSHIQGTDYEQGDYADKWNAIKFDSGKYGKILTNTSHLIYNRSTKKLATDSELGSIGDDANGIKQGTFSICGAKAYVKTNGLYAYNTVHKQSKDTRVSVGNENEMFCVCNGQTLYYKLKNTVSEEFHENDKNPKPWVEGKTYKNVEIKGKTYPKVTCVKKEIMAGHKIRFTFCPPSFLHAKSTDKFYDNAADGAQELYFCKAYQELRKQGDVTWLKAACIVCCIPIINYDTFKSLLGTTPSTGKGEGSETPFVVVPKLFACQLGAILYVHDQYNAQPTSKHKGLTLTGESMRTVIPCTSDATVMQYLSSLSQPARQVLKNYFSTICNNATFVGEYEKYAKAKKVSTDAVFSYETSERLLQPVMLIKLSRYAEGGGDKSEMLPKGFTESSYKTYMGGFLLGLKEAWQTGTVPETANTTTELIRQSPSTTREMYVALYQYLKLLYDRWIPAFNEDEWKMENFFQDDATRGHCFHFIDSYYTEIGDEATVNLQTIASTIKNLTAQNNFKSSLFQFITSIFEQNYFMLMCTQNFMDLSKKENMEGMFKTFPYNTMGSPKRHPDFIAMYTYSPSQRLNIANSQYKDDSFMLDGSDDPTKLPLPLQGLNTGLQADRNPYKLPAFGVAYGTQYQSYFTDIDINMNEAQATEVSIMTKMSIVEENLKMQGKTANFIGQDLFDVYSQNSWQCTIKMMGDAWVQPMMYFCLTNIPMFRGAYLIYKVEHNIEPGNMTTTFTGMRMSKVATPFNRNPYIAGTSMYDEEMQTKLRHKYAALTNNCEYEVFPLFETDVVGEDMSSILNERVSDKYYTRKPHASYIGIPVGEAIARCIYGEDCGLLTDKKIDDTAVLLHALLFYRDAKTNPKALCSTNRWNAYTESHPLNQHIFDLVKKVFANPAYVASLGLVTHCKSYGNVSYSNGTVFGKGKSIETPVKLTEDNLSKMGYTHGASSWKTADATHKQSNVVCQHCGTVYSADFNAKSCWNSQKSTTNTSTKDKVDLIGAFMNAVQKTVNSADAAACTLSHTVINKDKNIIYITEKSGETKHLGNVFDIILNGYYDYVKTLVWCVKSENNYIDANPCAISVTIQNGTNAGRNIGMGTYAEKSTPTLKSTTLAYSTEISTNYACAIYKKYNNNSTIYNKEVTTKVKDLESSVKLTDCETLLQPAGQGGTLQGNYIGTDRWNAGAASQYLIDNQNKTKHKCAAAVKSALSKGGLPYTDVVPGKDVVDDYVKKCGFTVLGRGSHTLTDAQYKSFMSNPQMGDICSFSYTAGMENAQYGHVAMYCGDGKWHSDYVQQQASPYKNSDLGWVYGRYSGGGVVKADTITVNWPNTHKETIIH